MTTRCRICNRALRDPASIELRVGRVCAERCGLVTRVSRAAAEKAKPRTKRLPRVRRRTRRTRWEQLEMFVETANNERIRLTGGAPKS